MAGTTSLHILVVGAGIGGLQTALALAKDGHRVTIFEAVQEFQEVCVSRFMHTKKPHDRC